MTGLRDAWAAAGAALAALPPRRRALLAGLALAALAVGVAGWIVQPLAVPSRAQAARRAASAAASGTLDARLALQDELAETVANLDGVRSARVHLTLPARDAGGQEGRPSASVVVTVADGRTLAAEQVGAVTRLVAAGVDGLAADAVTVVDERGRVLTGDRRDGAAPDEVSVEHQRAVERATEERIESLLATVVGPGKVIARVAAAIDFARTERTEETFDPDKTVVRETRSTREAAPDAKPADAAKARPAGDAAGRVERRDETQSYEVSKTTSRTVEPVGAVKRLSVAVLIDGTYRDENGRRVFVPRSDDELATLRTLAASAAGISEERGDRLEVTSVPFQSASGPVGRPFDAAAPWLVAVALRLLAVVLVGAIVALAVRPLVRALAPVGATGTLAEATSVVELTRKNVALVRDDPARAAALVRHWLVESGEPGA